MKLICNNCGKPLPAGAKVCRHCNTPTANAPQKDDKKFWEETAPLSSQHSGTFMSPPPLPQRSHKRRQWLIYVLPLVVIVVAVLISWLMPGNNSKKTKQKQEQTTTQIVAVPGGTIQITTNGNISSTDADSIMQVAMTEMQQTDSMMNAMMEQMMSGGALAGMSTSSLPDEIVASHASPQQQNRSFSGNSMVKLVGKMGATEIVMALNLKDPQNVKGTARYAGHNKEKTTMHLLGIQDGPNLTVSMYDTRNNLMGTFSGEFNGRIYRGYLNQNNKQTEFALVAE